MSQSNAFETEIATLEAKTSLILHRLAHDMSHLASVELSSPSFGGDDIEVALRRQKDFYHALVHDLPTRYRYVRLFEQHVSSLVDHPHDEVAGASSPMHRLLHFMYQWPVHAGGRAATVAEHVRACRTIKSLVVEPGDGTGESQTGVCAEFTTIWPNWDEIAQPTRGMLKQTIADMIQSNQASRSTPFIVPFSHSVWLLPSPDASLMPLASAHRILLQQYASTLFSDLLCGTSLPMFVTSLTLPHSDVRASSAQPALVLIPTPASSLLSDLLSSPHPHLSSAAALRHNVRLLELSLDSRSFTLKLVETLLVCPRYEGVNQIIAVPINNGEQATTNIDTKQQPAHTATQGGYPSATWNRDAKYALTRAPIAFPFNDSAYDCSHQVAGGVPTPCPCTQHTFLFENSVETKRVRTALLERLNVRRSDDNTH